MKETGNLRSLPVDSATTIGIIGILGTILPATALTAEALKSSVSVLDAMAEYICIDEPLPLVPENPSWSLKVTHNTVNLKEFESLLTSLRLNTTRSDLGREGVPGSCVH